MTDTLHKTMMPRASILSCSYKIFRVHSVYRQLTDSNDKPPSEKSCLVNITEMREILTGAASTTFACTPLPPPMLFSTKEWHACQELYESCFPPIPFITRPVMLSRSVFIAFVFSQCKSPLVEVQITELGQLSPLSHCDLQNESITSPI